MFPTLLTSVWGWISGLTALLSPSAAWPICCVLAVALLLCFAMWLLSDDDRTIRAATLLEALPWGRGAKE